MKTLDLAPNQIITLNDYPVHSNSVLKEYYAKCKQGETLPYVPVIKKELVSKHFDTNLLREFKHFEHQNPHAEYFMLDGSHRTTALTLVYRKISVLVYESDKDIMQAKKLVSSGKILQNGTLDYSLEENCEVLKKHFTNKPYFMTVEQKTEKMVRDGKLPLDMTFYRLNS